jgi:hypothetical protein
MGTILSDKNQRVAATAVSGIFGRYKLGKTSRDQALIAIGYACASNKVSDLLIGKIANAQLRHHLGPGDVIGELLLAAGGDVDTAEQMNLEQPPGRVPWASANRP